MKDLSMQIINVRSAGIDVGSRFHVVAVDQRSENVRQFGVYSEDQQAMIEWLRLHQIQSIAMESALSVEFPSITKIDFPVQQKLAVVQFMCLVISTHRENVRLEIIFLTHNYFLFFSCS